MVISNVWSVWSGMIDYVLLLKLWVEHRISKKQWMSLQNYHLACSSYNRNNKGGLIENTRTLLFWQRQGQEAPKHVEDEQGSALNSGLDLYYRYAERGNAVHVGGRANI